MPFSQKRRCHKYESHEEAIDAQKAVEAAFRPEVALEYRKSKIKDLLTVHLNKCPYSRISRNRKILVPTFLKRFGVTLPPKTGALETS